MAHGEKIAATANRDEQHDWSTGSVRHRLATAARPMSSDSLDPRDDRSNCARLDPALCELFDGIGNSYAFLTRRRSCCE
jgi:hypothetical protein